MDANSIKSNPIVFINGISNTCIRNTAHPWEVGYCIAAVYFILNSVTFEWAEVQTGFFILFAFTRSSLQVSKSELINSLFNNIPAVSILYQNHLWMGLSQQKWYNICKWLLITPHDRDCRLCLNIVCVRACVSEMYKEETFIKYSNLGMLSYLSFIPLWNPLPNRPTVCGHTSGLHFDWRLGQLVVVSDGVFFNW